ncbi:MAG: glycosyltransferase family 2 protein [Bacteroidia bacterium]|nr:glycosyltransferase family 2 protein [Bacteroidia bacterium]
MSEVKPDISVIIPVFNSAALVARLYERLVVTLNGEGLNYELIYVEDRGTDDSWGELKKLKQVDPERVTIIRLTRNYGQNNATFCGILHARGKVVVTIDDDLESPPEEIPKLLAAFRKEEFDVVYGMFPNRKHSIFRRFGSGLIKFIFKRFVYGMEIGSSFRLMSEGLAEAIRTHTYQLMLIDQVIPWHTADIGFVQVDHARRPEGRSNYNLFSLLALAWRLIIHYTALPLRLMTYLGLIASLGSFGLGAFYFYQKIFHGAQPGFSATIVAILFSAGIILFSLGIVGEYISRLYVHRSNRPLFAIKEKR